MVRHLAFAFLCALGLGLGARSAAAQEPGHPDHPGHADHADHPGHADHAARGEHGAEHADHGKHGGHADHEINWFHGMLFERDGVEPSLLFRPKGTPPPVAALLLNALLLYYVLYRFGAPRIREGLKRRKTDIVRGMDEARRMKEEAQARLASYEAELARIDDDIERVRREMREAGEAERARVLRDAQETRRRMEQDARLLVDQELAATRDLLLRQTAANALRSAESRLQKELTEADQQRLANEFLAGVGTAVERMGARS